MAHRQEDIEKALSGAVSRVLSRLQQSDVRANSSRDRGQPDHEDEREMEDFRVSKKR